MQRHEQFEELCALAAIGDLPRDRQDALMEHLATCGSCRQSYQDYCLLLHEMPTVENDVEKLVQPPTTLENALKERFWARAKAENIGLSKEAERQLVPRRRTLRVRVPHFPIRPAVLWPAVSVVAAVIVVFSIFAVEKLPSFRHGSTAEVAAVPTSTQNPDSSPSANTQPSEASTELSRTALEELERQNAHLADRLVVLKKQLESSQEGKQQLERSISKLTAQNVELQAQGSQNSQLAAQRQGEVEKLRTEHDQLVASLVAQQTLATDLAERMKFQTASIDRDRQLLSADGDIRDLMGARSLHIIDVRDADSRGKDKKSFGRVFFTEGKSLIFYAFDLDENKLVNARFSYQAWGERNGKPESARSLGIFYSDDRAQKRWVLKVDNPAELEGIDSVFVTLEPAGERYKPSGRKLLYAFLNSRANHP